VKDNAKLPKCSGDNLITTDRSTRKLIVTKCMFDMRRFNKTIRLFNKKQTPIYAKLAILRSGNIMNLSSSTDEI
jgi:hypothetical protein